MYKIYYTYTTGSTFSTERGCPGEHEYVFNDLDKAKAALKRMKEHYEWETDRRSAYTAKEAKAPSWWKKSPDEIKYNISYNYSFNVEGNDGEEVWLNGSTYLGYFEYLEEAEIRHVTPEEDDMRITF
jgi:hypothetical protein